MIGKLSCSFVFYRTGSGRPIIATFYRKLPAAARKKCYSYLVRTRSRNLINLPTNICEKMDRNLWEVKPEYNNIEYRFLLGWIADYRIRIVYAEIKKSRKLPRRDIELAMKRLKEMRGKVGSDE